jgi:hypothetical protein
MNRRDFFSSAIRSLTNATPEPTLPISKVMELLAQTEGTFGAAPEDASFRYWCLYDFQP